MKLYHFFYLFLFLFFSHSCKTSDFIQIEELTKLNGRYYSKSIPKENKNDYRDYQAHMMLLVNELKVDLSSIYYVDVRFEEPNKLHLTYPIIKTDSTTKSNKLTTQTFSIEGKRKKKFLEIYFNKDSFNIPFIYGRTNIDRLKIGVNKHNELLFEKFRERSGNVLILGGGMASTSKFIFHPYNQYKDIKPFYQEGKWGAMKNNTIIIPPKYDGVTTLKQNYIKVKQNHLWGLLDNTGKEIIPPIYDDIELGDYLQKAFYVTRNGKYGVVSLSGVEIASPIYDRVSRFNEDFFILYLNDKSGLCTAEKMIYPAIYNHLGMYSTLPHRYADINKEYISAKRNGIDYFLDKNGYEYEINRKIPTFNWIQNIYPLKETARKVSLDEQ